MIVQDLDVIALIWKYQLIGIAKDGASTMTGCIAGITTRLVRDCYSQMFQIWCGAQNQLDLVVKKAFSKLCSDSFLTILAGITGHLCCQLNLINKLKTTCPSFVTTHWMSMETVL
jgi:hypothetical protein